jgi:hypothetical protein
MASVMTNALSLSDSSLKDDESLFIREIKEDIVYNFFRRCPYTRLISPDFCTLIGPKSHEVGK